MKGIYVILDGASDLPSPVLDGKTPLEAAATPNLDYFASKSKINYCYTVKEGVAPESSSAVVSLMGFDPTFAPRGPLETVGAGIHMKKGDLALRCNFATIDDIDSKNILDSRAGRTLTNKEAFLLAKEINEKVNLPFKFEFHPIRGHRAVLVFRGGFSDNISNADPFYNVGSAKVEASPKVSFSKPLDDEEDSKLSSDLVNKFLLESHDILDASPINRERARKGLYAANFILCRDAGNEPIKFKKLKGRWLALGYNPLEIGIAKACGMDVYSFKYPKLKNIDVYDNLHAGLKKAIKYAVRMIRWKKKKYDYFYVHFKETDLPGHDNKPIDKVKMIEMIDKYFFYYLRKVMTEEKLIVTADHTTACKLKRHTDDPVPVLIYPLGDVEEKRFTEKEGLNGKKIISRKLLEQYMFD